MSRKFDPDQPLGQALTKWWEELQNRNADRAELRRAKSVSDVILLPAFQRACVRFKPYFQYEENWENRLAAIIGLMAHIRATSDESLALAMSGSPKPALSELRFRRLIQRDRADLYLALIRVIRKLGNEANLSDLANSVYYWGDQVKRDWAFAYFPNTPEKAST